MLLNELRAISNAQIAASLEAHLHQHDFFHAVKQALVGHCEAWQANFTGLLNSIALKELQALHEYFETNSAALRRPPTNLDTLAETVQLHRKLALDKPAIQARFEPLHDKYHTLEKFEVILCSAFSDQTTLPLLLVCSCTDPLQY